MIHAVKKPCEINLTQLNTFMHRIKFFQLQLLMLLTGLANAQDGGQLYTTYCSACHGPDGKGVGGQFPALAGSAWVEGDAGRAVKVVLHGLHGKVEVEGRTFNLEMPPQGMVLSDEHIAAILSYVRTSWGNSEELVTAKFVNEVRSAHADRKGPWTAEELQKLHPLRASKPMIDGLEMSYYKGAWNKIPDFASLKPEKTESIASGVIEVPKELSGDGFGLVWEGEITAPKQGIYQFLLAADDGARIMIDGNEIARVDGVGPMTGQRMKAGNVKLTEGAHALRLEYFEASGQQGVALAWNGPGLGNWRNLTAIAPHSIKKPLLLQAANGRASIYRNFIAGTSARAIGIGFPGALNLAYSADRFGVELIWTGDFISGARHWTERGLGAEAPAGTQLAKLTNSLALPQGAKFRGYKLDKAGNPTFSVQVAEQTFQDSWRPVGSASSPALRRELVVSGDGAPLEVLIAENLECSALGGGKFGLGSALTLQVENATPEVRAGKVYLKVAPGKQVAITYHWKSSI